LRRSPGFGFDLSQRDYFNSSYILNITDMTQSFKWISRGNHPVNDTCSDCHSDYDASIYPPSAQILMNVSGKDCSNSCHEWINPTTTSIPFTLLNQSSNPFPKHMEIFENATTGGCAGTCHQPNPSSPIFDGTGHGEITDCLDSSCHGPGFIGSGGPIHDDHIFHVENYTVFTGVACYDVCHKSGLEFGEPIDGGCYNCHKSGHDPQIMDTSPCYISGCHDTNQP
jgi:hypothetical protein